MQIGLYQSVSGMKAMMAYQNNLSSNLARQSIVGGRSTSTAFEVLEEQPNQLKGMLGVHRPVGNKALPLQTVQVVNFSQGPLQATGKDTDFAIQGESFFAVREPSVDGQGVVRYTRDGQFHLDPQGNVVTTDGAQVLLDNGQPFKLDPNLMSQQLSVLTSGTVFSGQNATPLGKLQLAHFEDPRSALKSTSTGRFEVADPTLVQNGPAQNDQVVQGYVEGSNTDAVTSMVDMISVTRAYEANQKAVMAQDETNDRLISSVTQGM